jgi:TPR repeat protein
MKLLLEKLSRYWQLRFLAVLAGVALIVYAVLLPTHDNDGNDSAISAVSASQLQKAPHTDERVPVMDGNIETAKGGENVQAPTTWLQLNQAAAAQLNLAADQFAQEDFPRDFSESIRQLRRASNEGDATAQILLGHAYERGLGVPKDMAETARLYARAAEAHPSGNMNSDSPVNYSQALESYRKAAEQGDPSAQLYLGLVNDVGEDTPRNVSEAVRWYRKAAAQGSASAACNLGLLYHNGDGMPKDDIEAAVWLERAAVRGSASAQYAMGQMYAQGDGVQKNDSMAAEWLEKAAGQGNAPAQVILSSMYASGRGVPGNTARAYMWINLASASEQQARDSREQVERAVPPVVIAEGQRLTHDWLLQHRGVGR